MTSIRLLLRFISRILFGLIVSCYSIATYAANCTAAPVSGQLYSIVNLGSGLALDVNTSDTSATPNVITYEYWGGTNQQFYLYQQSDGYWRIQSAYNNMDLEVLNVSTSDGANIDTYGYWGGENQQWQLVQSTTGAFNIRARHSGKSVTVAGAENVANVYQNADAAESSQRWFFNPVNGSCGSASGVDGFASQSGSDGLSTTTGGGNTTPIRVTSCSALRTALSSSAAAVIQIPDNTTIDCHPGNQLVAACPLDCANWNDPGKTWYRLPTDSSQTCESLGSSSNHTVNVNQNATTIYVHSNKTLEGLGSGSKVSGATLYLSHVQNVIVHNLTLDEINPALVEAGDGITVNDSSHVFVNHVAFNRISDGFVDISNSHNVTLSWNRFYGYNSDVCANQHWYTNLVNNSQVTFHHNFWDRAAGRNPLVEGNSRVHLYNNYWKDITYFAIGARDGGEVLAENNYFENSARVQWNQGNGYFSASGNVYTGISATDTYKATGDNVFTDVSMYPYTLDDPHNLGSAVDGGTGPQ
ncbi:RICIN domain-containing protein [Celerinatantimonas sp. YJH-8]|uniref:RICIN domain-containing protein n=1 Tax=Celerinatantimonas sp. YJH-8 TaxID=3228714 RepID=UPI0038C59282